MRSSALSLLCGLSAIHSTAGVSIPRNQQESYKSTGKHGAVASEVAVCSESGVEMLKMGGTAADAVSSTYCWSYLFACGRPGAEKFI